LYLLENLTWSQAKDAFSKCRTAIIPIGSTEQHGPHLPLGTDFFTAQYFSDALAKADYNAIVTPTLPIGFADYHSDFAGTLSLTFNTVTAVVSEICEKLISYGITHILFFNTHGGNAGPLGQTAYDLRKKGVVAATYMWFETVGNLKDEWKLLGHGDAVETSFVLAHRPGICDPSKAIRPVETHYSDDLQIKEKNHVVFKGVMPVHFQMRVKDVSETGAMLEPSLYPDADHGQWMEGVNPQTAADITKAIVQYVVEFLPEFEKISFDKIK
jgi:creatinine amidohydrolase